MNHGEILSYEYLDKIINICEEAEHHLEDLEMSYTPEFRHIKEAVFLQIEELKECIGHRQIKEWKQRKELIKK